MAACLHLTREGNGTWFCQSGGCFRQGCDLPGWQHASVIFTPQALVAMVSVTTAGEHEAGCIPNRRGTTSKGRLLAHLGMGGCYFLITSIWMGRFIPRTAHRHLFEALSPPLFTAFSIIVYLCLLKVVFWTFLLALSDLHSPIHCIFRTSF